MRICYLLYLVLFFINALQTLFHVQRPNYNGIKGLEVILNFWLVLAVLSSLPLEGFL